MIESVLNVIYVHKPYWNSLCFQDYCQQSEVDQRPGEVHVPRVISNHPPPYIGKHDTRREYLKQPAAVRQLKLRELETLKKGT